MLSKNKIEFLCELVGIKVVYADGFPVGYMPEEANSPKKFSKQELQILKELDPKFTDNFYRCSYDDAKKAMGAEDMRFHWLLTEKLYMAGGSVLNWVWGENKNEDFDFFLTEPNIDFALLNFIKEIGFVKVNKTHYADTYSDKNNTLVQIVNLQYGTPEKILSNFDINVCRFAVSSEYFYTTRRAVIDLLSMTITLGAKSNNNKAISRLLKYSRKGFYINRHIVDSFNYSDGVSSWENDWNSLNKYSDIEETDGF